MTVAWYWSWTTWVKMSKQFVEVTSSFTVLSVVFGHIKHGELVFSQERLQHRHWVIQLFKSFLSLAIIKRRLIFQHSSHQSFPLGHKSSFCLSRSVPMCGILGRPRTQTKFTSKLVGDVAVVLSETHSILEPHIVRHVDFKANSPPLQVFFSEKRCSKWERQMQRHTLSIAQLHPEAMHPAFCGKQEQINLPFTTPRQTYVT